MNTPKKDRKEEAYEISPYELVFTSGVVSRLLGIPVWVLKQLDREKVVSPPRKQRRARLYSRTDLKKIERVWYYMSEKSVNVDGVKIILELEERYGTSQ